MEVTRPGWQSGDEGMGPSVPAPRPRAWVSVASPRACVHSGAGGDAAAWDSSPSMTQPCRCPGRRTVAGWQSDHVGGPHPFAQMSIH